MASPQYFTDQFQPRGVDSAHPLLPAPPKFSPSHITDTFLQNFPFFMFLKFELIIGQQIFFLYLDWKHLVECPMAKYTTDIRQDWFECYDEPRHLESLGGMFS